MTNTATAIAEPVPTTKKPKSLRPVRDNIESFAIAILFAVLLKPFLIEAYMIPTPSMQPTMMGSREAGVHDRLLVDKLCYAWGEPKRWDIAVFRYPIRLIQSYVKRIVGLPGDRFIIAGGNLVPVDAAGKEQTPLRRPAKLQSRIWMNLFPARMHIDGGTRALESFFSPQPTRGWTEEGGVLQVSNEPQRSVTLSYVDSAHGGVCNRIYDGHATSVARAMRSSPELGGIPYEGVPDARIGFTLTPSAAVDDVSIELDVKRTGKKSLRFGLTATGGQGKLWIKEDGREVKASESFPFALPLDSATAVRFTHLDGQLRAEHDGTVAGELECLPYLVLDEVEMQPRSGASGSYVSGVAPFIAVRGGGTLRFGDLTIDRDLHYKRGTVPKGQPIEVPAGHYFMMGDNPDQSADAREWTALTVGVDAQARIVDPSRNPAAAKMVGNARARGLSDPVDADENPVLVPEHDAVVFTDLVGEVHVLRGKPALGTDPDKSYGAQAVWFEGEAGPWRPQTHKVQFVPRAHVLGRPVLSFWPIWPFGPHRFDVIR